MTIERTTRDGDITVVCDGAHCPQVEDTGTDDFHEAIAHIKAHGWAVRKDCGEWFHLCRSCK